MESSQLVDKIDRTDAEITATLRAIELNFLGALEQVDRIQKVARRYMRSVQRFQALAGPWKQRFAAVAQDNYTLSQHDDHSQKSIKRERQPLQGLCQYPVVSVTDSAARIRALLPNRPRTVDWGDLSALLKDESVLDESRENWFGLALSPNTSTGSVAKKPLLELSERRVLSSAREMNNLRSDAAAAFRASPEDDDDSLDQLVARVHLRNESLGGANATLSRSGDISPADRQLEAGGDASFRGHVEDSSSPDQRSLPRYSGLDMDLFPEKFRNGPGARQLQQLYALFCRHPGRSYTSSRLIERLDDSFSPESVELLCGLLASRHYLVPISGPNTPTRWTLAEGLCDQVLPNETEVAALAAPSFPAVETE
jgi:hypothetical protein